MDPMRILAVLLGSRGWRTALRAWGYLLLGLIVLMTALPIALANFETTTALVSWGTAAVFLGWLVKVYRAYQDGRSGKDRGSD